MQCETTDKKRDPDMTQIGAEPGRSRMTHSDPKALLTILGGIDSLPWWTLTWEAELWLKANIVLVVKEPRNEDGTTKVKLIPVALHEKPIELMESVALDQAVDHLVTLMQTQHVGMRVKDEAEAMIGAVRRLLSDDDNSSIAWPANAFGPSVHHYS